MTRSGIHAEHGIASPEDLRELEPLQRARHHVSRVRKHGRNVTKRGLVIRATAQEDVDRTLPHDARQHVPEECRRPCAHRLPRRHRARQERQRRIEVQGAEARVCPPAVGCGGKDLWMQRPVRCASGDGAHERPGVARERLRVLRSHRKGEQARVALVAEPDAVRNAECHSEDEVRKVADRIRAEHDVVPRTPQRTE